MKRAHFLTAGRFIFLGLAALLVFSGCDKNMKNQSKYKAQGQSKFFKDGRADRPLVEGTIPRGFLRADEALYQGKKDGQLVDAFPIEVTKEVMARGRERFNIYCSVCHGATGDGLGPVVRRGFKQPPSFHDEKLRNMPAGHFFDVITHGFGVMPDYAVQVNPVDRWAIIAYIRALQFSQHASVNDVPVTDRPKLEEKQETK